MTRDTYEALIRRCAQLTQTVIEYRAGLSAALGLMKDFWPREYDNDLAAAEQILIGLGAKGDGQPLESHIASLKAEFPYEQG